MSKETNKANLMQELRAALADHRNALMYVSYASTDPFPSWRNDIYVRTIREDEECEFFSVKIHLAGEPVAEIYRAAKAEVEPLVSAMYDLFGTGL